MATRLFGLRAEDEAEESDHPTAANSVASRLELVVFTHKRCKLSLAGVQQSAGEALRDPVG